MLEFIKFVQSFSTPFLDMLFMRISDICSPVILSVIATIVYWGIDKKKGVGIAIVTAYNVSLNSVLKNIFKVPRPFLKDSEIRRIDTHSSYGYSFPSGHSQVMSAVSTSGYLAFKNNCVKYLGIIFAVLVAFSRIYLGVHTPLDVFTGLVLGFLISIVIYSFAQKIVDSDNYVRLMLCTLPLYIMMIFLKDGDLYKITGLITWFLAGYIIDEKTFSFKPHGSVPIRIVKITFGLIILLSVKSVVDTMPDRLFFDYLRYSILGILISLIIPALFMLAGKIYGGIKK